MGRRKEGMKYRSAWVDPEHDTKLQALMTLWGTNFAETLNRLIDGRQPTVINQQRRQFNPASKESIRK
jgi:hypothetical protein